MATQYEFLWQSGEAEAATEGVPSKGPTYRSIYAKDGFPALPANMHSTWDLFVASKDKYAKNRMLGHRKIGADGVAGEYVWLTYQEVYDIVIPLGSAIRHMGVEPKGRCGVYGVNCPEWFMAMEACNSHSMMCVPLYDTLGPEAVEFIINHAEVAIAFVQSTKLNTILASLSKCTEYLKTIVSFSTSTEEQKATASASGVTLYDWQDFVALGVSNPAPALCPPTSSDISTIMYTSGTTGEPKGVLLTHESVLTCANGLDHFLKCRNETLNEKDVYFSFLPLAHIFDRVSEEFFVYIGASIGFWQGDIKKITEDLAELKPTIFIGVPRVFDRIYTGISSKITTAGGMKKWLFDLGYSLKLKSLWKGSKQEKAFPLADKIVFNKVKMGLGGNVRLIISGAAPLAAHVEEFLRVVTCAPVVQGYGLTESCAASFIQMPNVISNHGTVGPPLPSIDVRLVSVPELNYDALSDPPRGEICIKGKTLFSGYHKRPDLTEEVLTSDGWFSTGDIGEWQKDGALKIIDRKKNIFKLSQGEYVAVENLESIYGQCEAVDQIWVYGNSLESTLVAVAVPNEATIKEWAKSNGSEDDMAKLCQDPNAQAYILSQLNLTGKAKKVKGFEVLKGLHLEPLPFDVERNLLTPTFKLKRPQLLQYYKTQIDALYANQKKQ